MTKSTFPQKNVFSGLKIDWVKLSELFPTLKTSKSNFPSFIQRKKWQSPIFRIYSNHKILQTIFQTFPPSKMTKSNFPHLFPPLKIIKSNFPHFFRPKKWQSPNFRIFFCHSKWLSPTVRAFSDLKNGKVQISKLFSESPATGGSIYHQ